MHDSQRMSNPATQRGKSTNVLAHPHHTLHYNHFCISLAFECRYRLSDHKYLDYTAPIRKSTSKDIAALNRLVSTVGSEGSQSNSIRRCSAFFSVLCPINKQ